MTDNEIIKALMCCINHDDESQCMDCPAYNTEIDDCHGIPWNYILDLINRQKAEIERLKLECGLAKFDKYKAEFEEFRAEIKAGAIKEFAEMLKWKAVATHKSIDNKYLYQIDNCFIDELVKEMVGDENGRKDR